MMDHLLFKIEQRPDNINGIVAIPFINGQSLIDIIKEIELQYEPDIAGSYDGYRPDLLLNELNKGLHQDTYKTKILECECGVDGCWSLLMKVSKTENTIVWSNFNQPLRDNWDYSSLPSFEFNKDEYDIAIGQLNKETYSASV